MSRKYEGLVILNTKSIEGTIDDLVATVSKEIESEGANVADVRQLGRRKFAYASRHLESGHYVSYSFKAEPETITRIQEKLKLNGNVHLQHFQRVA
ncbi:30S ribosomal protein S6 [Luteolibacter flavescens]|uniref:Small ribosomal subunit protein bS6 n=1 Tax=Luteolibacter flavescens TaxID=1859460 RepID=A0ABT3FT70_9BACT|nr:30S ribosomal protein S6 [Luteolibacter flavescens]MCW1886763.1 30S ribosomal protein S6 [Luteolibacter flavescens]